MQEKTSAKTPVKAPTHSPMPETTQSNQLPAALPYMIAGQTGAVASLHPTDVQSLQPLVGNRTVQRLINPQIQRDEDPQNQVIEEQVGTVTNDNLTQTASGVPLEEAYQQEQKKLQQYRLALKAKEGSATTKNKEAVATLETELRTLSDELAAVELNNKPAIKTKYGDTYPDIRYQHLIQDATNLKYLEEKLKKVEVGDLTASENLGDHFSNALADWESDQYPKTKKFYTDTYSEAAWEKYESFRRQLNLWNITGDGYASAQAYLEEAFADWEQASTKSKSYFNGRNDNLKQKSLNCNYLNLKRLYKRDGVDNIFTYFDTNVQSASFLGGNIPMHKDLKAKLDLVSASLVAQGATIEDAKPWSLTPRTLNDNYHRLSNHAYGRAVDIRVTNNPHVTNKQMRLVINDVCNSSMTEVDKIVMASILGQPYFKDLTLEQKTKLAMEVITAGLIADNLSDKPEKRLGKLAEKDVYKTHLASEYFKYKYPLWVQENEARLKTQTDAAKTVAELLKRIEKTVAQASPMMQDVLDAALKEYHQEILAMGKILGNPPALYTDYAAATPYWNQLSWIVDARITKTRAENLVAQQKTVVIALRDQLAKELKEQQAVGKLITNTKTTGKAYQKNGFFDIPAVLVKAMKEKGGLTWGGEWELADFMHFELK